MPYKKQKAEIISQWQEILKCILDAVFFLAEYNLSFHGSNSKIEDPDNRVLDALELLGKHNRVLALGLQKVKMHKKRIIVTYMQTHYLSWGSQKC